MLLFGANMHFFFTVDLYVRYFESGYIKYPYLTCYVVEQFVPFFIEGTFLV